MWDGTGIEQGLLYYDIVYVRGSRGIHMTHWAGYREMLTYLILSEGIKKKKKKGRGLLVSSQTNQTTIVSSSRLKPYSNV